MQAKVLLPLALEKELNYRIPEAWLKTVAVGKRVVVELGKSQKRIGLVIEIIPLEETTEYELKDILEVLDEKPLVTEEEIAFWRFLSYYYIVSLGSILAVALPSALLSYTARGKGASQPQGEEVARLGKGFRTEEALRDVMGTLQGAHRQRHLLARFLELLPRDCSEGPLLSGSVPLKTLFADLPPNKKTNLQATWQRLRSKHPSLFEVAHRPLEQPSSSPTTPPRYQDSTSQLPRDTTKPIIFWASNDDEQYHFIANEVHTTLRRGLRVLLLLPQSSSPECDEEYLRQLLNLPDVPIAILTGQTSSEKRLKLRQRLLETDQPLLIVGSRLATFIPSNLLGLIIIAEEQDLYYKQQEPSPRFHARDSLIFRASKLAIPILLTAVTPSLETLYNLHERKYHLIKHQPNAPRQAVDLEVIDLKRERKIGRLKWDKMLTKPLRDEISKTLNRGEKVLLIAARKGYAPYLFCTECGESLRCHQCDVSLTYHQARQRLVCPYCGYSTVATTDCPTCREKGLQTATNSLKQRGFGTERLEEELAHYYPHSSLARIDAETTIRKSDRKALKEQVRLGQADIYLGTTVVTRLTSLQEIGLVALPQLDLLASFPDFRNDEQLYTMLVRLAKRFPTAKLVIQTSDTQHPLLAQLQHSPLEKVLEELLKERDLFGFPPYQRLIRLIVKETNRSIVEDAASLIAETLRSEEQAFAEVQGPFEPSVGRVKLYYIRHITLRLNPHTSSHYVRTTIHHVLAHLQQRYSYCRRVKLFFDVDPY